VLPSQIIDLLDKVLDFGAVLTVGPLSTVADAPVLVINSDSTALGDPLPSTSLDRLLEELPRVLSIVNTQTVVQLAKVHSVLQSAVLGEIFRRNLGVIAGHAHSKAKVDLRVGVEVSCTEFDGVSKALRWAMEASNTVILRSPVVLSASVQLGLCCVCYAYFPI